jgi:hypothetical protein
MVDQRSNEERDDEARLAAAYLDMWEVIASAHALKGPPREGFDWGHERGHKRGVERAGDD